MSFECPQCLHIKALRITASIELPPDARSDEIMLQVVHCLDCKFEGLAVYEESTRGALDSESVDHYGYTAGQRDIRLIRALIKKCPSPNDAGCQCESHQKLAVCDKSGRWLKPAYRTKTEVFPIKY